MYQRPLLLFSFTEHRMFLQNNIIKVTLNISAKNVMKLFQIVVFSNWYSLLAALHNTSYALKHLKWHEDTFSMYSVYDDQPLTINFMET
jgi:hypothetical protein